MNAKSDNDTPQVKRITLEGLGVSYATGNPNICTEYVLASDYDRDTTALRQRVEELEQGDKEGIEAMADVIRWMGRCERLEGLVLGFKEYKSEICSKLCPSVCETNEPQPHHPLCSLVTFIDVSRAEATLAALEGLVGRLPKWDQLTITHFEADLITKLMCDPQEAGTLAGLLKHRQEEP